MNRIIKKYTPRLSPNSLEVVQKRYLRLNKNGKPCETPAEMFYRVASFMAKADAFYLAKSEKKYKSKIITSTTEKFYKTLALLKFLPGGRVLFEAGNSHTGQFSSCFVIPIKDSIKDIFESLSNAAIIQQNNGGTGFNFSHIRPRGDKVKNIPNIAAGPIHYIKTFDTALSKVLQGSKRHGANMGILSIDHPDILDFIELKNGSSQLKNFNISVGVTADFMEKVREDKDYYLINPRTKEKVKKLSARKIFNLIIEKAWTCADPGIIFLDRLNASNPTPHLGKIEATNPCGEQPLLPYESCNLGSIVFPNHIKNKKIDWDEMKKTVKTAIHFMDNMIDRNHYSLPQIKENVLKTRKIGLGLMGFAEGLYKLSIPYNSNKAVKLIEQILKFIKEEGIKASSELAKTRGVFPTFHGSIYDKRGIKIRNSTITTIAPNGTISMVANTSSGIEPVFALVNSRKTFFENGSKNEASKTLLFVDPTFSKVANEEGFYSKNLLEKIAEHGSIQNLNEVPEKFKKIFVTAHDISYDWHVKIQAAAQKYTDNAVSKTINFPQNATIDDIRRAYIMAYELGCKGITVYRDGSKENQILYTGKIKDKKSYGSHREEIPEIVLEKSFDKIQFKQKGFSKTNLTQNALMVLEKRALKKDKYGKIIETPNELFKRVAHFIASADKLYPAFRKKIKKTEEKFYQMQADLEFISGQALRNAGDGKLTLSACFVLPIKDSIEGIMKAMTENVLVHKATCGTGINFSHLRSKNSQVGSTKELASGPVTFMKAFDQVQDTIRTKGGRKQGSMVILNINHPDIEEFIKVKDDPKALTNFNISVGITDDFVKALNNDKFYSLVDPHTNKEVKKVRAKEIFDLIVDHAWRSGDPGVLFLDRIEEDNPTPHLGKIEATNPCGEQPLLPYETCNLGSIVLPNMLKEEQGRFEIDYKKLKETVRYAVHFLDNTIDLNHFPLPQMEKMAGDNRKIGLGVMGFADMLIKLKIPYNSDRAVKLAENLMRTISREAHSMSYELGKKKGSFKNFRQSIWYKKKKFKAMRNAAITTIAPTGYTSIVASCSSGIEPVYALVFRRQNSMGGVEQFEAHSLFLAEAKKRGFASPNLIKEIFQKGGSIQDLKKIPNDVKKIFVTSRDISPEWDLKIQAVFQKYTDNAVSKTINFKNSAEKKDIAEVYQKAYELSCKGVTVYRDGCKDLQVLKTGEASQNKPTEDKKTEVQNAKQILKPRPRPEVVRGSTYELKTTYGGLYVTINNDEEGNPFEVFATIGKSGGFFAAESEAICRLISLALRSGIPAAQVMKQLFGIRGPMPSWTKKGTILSIPDAIAKILSEHVKKDQTKLPLGYQNNSKINLKESKIKSQDQIKLEEVLNNLKKSEEKKEFKSEVKENHSSLLEDKNLSSIADRGFAPECPDCGGILEFGEGCMTCRACGYSKCS
jgi:ribonucleoside-diphosphate reductase alpha chain